LSKIRMDVERYMDGPLITDSILTSSFMFPSEFIGFQGHFPTHKILPGACQIQCIISTIEKALEKRVVLKEILVAKYIAPVLPGDKVICTVSGVPATGIDIVYKARIAKGTEKVSDLKLRVSLSDSI
jgi:3-hydroxymyristoyl/3-hydroxydecanoyl-(acyl carrier protein) dehydratase